MVLNNIFHFALPNREWNMYIHRYFDILITVIASPSLAGLGFATTLGHSKLCYMFIVLTILWLRKNLTFFSQAIPKLQLNTKLKWFISNIFVSRIWIPLDDGPWWSMCLKRTGTRMLKTYVRMILVWLCLPKEGDFITEMTQFWLDNKIITLLSTPW